MSVVMHPVGPHSSGVYWVRRMIAAAVAVALIILVVVWLTNRGSGPDVDAAASTQTSGPTSLTGVLAPAPSDPAVPGLDGSSLPMTEPASDSGSVSGSLSGSDSAAPSGTDKSGTKSTSTAATSTAASGTATTTAAAKTTATTKATKTKATTTKATKTKASKTSAPAKTTPKPKTTTSTAPPPPSYDKAGRLICPDSAIAVTAGTRSATYPVGAFPVLTLTVANTGSKSCVRDVSGKLQVFTVYSANGDRVWSTADCFPGTGTEIHQFNPGEKRTYPVTWSGTTSEPKCPDNRVTVKAGNYTVVAALGALKSKPAAFTFTP